MKELISSQSYKDASPEEKNYTTNGCGQQGIFGKLVPNTIWFLSIKEACNIHDWDYDNGTTIEDKKRADVNFLHNMNFLICNGAKWLRKPRRERAAKYYFAVKFFGESAFWGEE